MLTSVSEILCLLVSPLSGFYPVLSQKRAEISLMSLRPRWSEFGMFSSSDSGRFPVFVTGINTKARDGCAYLEFCVLFDEQKIVPVFLYTDES